LAGGVGSHARRKAQRLVSETGLESGPEKMEKGGWTDGSHRETEEGQINET